MSAISDNRTPKPYQELDNAMEDQKLTARRRHLGQAPDSRHPEAILRQISLSTPFVVALRAADQEGKGAGL